MSEDSLFKTLTTFNCNFSNNARERVYYRKKELIWFKEWIFLLYLWEKVLCFSPHHSVCLSVCLSVCVCVCVSVCVSVITFAARWLDLATWCQLRLILSTRTWKCNTSQDDPFPFPFPFHMDHPYKITFWPVSSRLMDGSTPNFTCM